MLKFIPSFQIEVDYAKGAPLAISCIVLKELLVLFPELRSRGREIVKRLFYLDEHIDMLRDGRNNAGIET